MSAEQKYLSRYAEPECQQLDGFNTRFQQGLVIPLYREHPGALSRFVEFAEDNPHSLLIAVINRPESDGDTAWCQAFFNQQRPLQWQSANQQLQLYRTANDSGLLLVDRCWQHPAIPDQQGVGLARKIGADILCALIAENKVQSPWIYNTDADAHLPGDYFSATGKQAGTCAAQVYPFAHCFPDKELKPLPTLLYEFSLHYYVAGLQWAGSPYAFHTLGSTLAVHQKAYAQVRGFPKRSGAEDFYLLNKVAKTGPVVCLEKPLIELEARESTRVPFGTGPAVKKLSALGDPRAMTLYHPDCFRYLKVLLEQLQHYADDETPPDKVEATIDTALLNAITADMGLEKALAHARQQGRTGAARLQHLRQWFDGFRTLKFIHQLRDRQLASIRFSELASLGEDSAYSAFTSPRMRALLTEIDRQA